MNAKKHKSYPLEKRFYHNVTQVGGMRYLFQNCKARKKADFPIEKCDKSLCTSKDNFPDMSAKYVDVQHSRKQT